MRNAAMADGGKSAGIGLDLNGLVMVTALMLLVASMPVVLSWLSMSKRKEQSDASDEAKEKEESKEKNFEWWGDITLEELKQYNGVDSAKPILVAIKGHVYDVTAGKEFYGQGGPYNLFTGIDASRALAKMSFKPEDLNGDTEGLSASERDILHDWEQKFMLKYKHIANVVT